MSDFINRPAQLVQYWYANFAAPYSFGGNNSYAPDIIFKDEKQIAEYNANPDLYATRHFGFTTVDEYREWVEEDGIALCSEHTKTGKLCRISLGGPWSASEWRRQHRSRPCALHIGPEVEERVHELRNNGTGIYKIASLLHISEQRVRRIIGTSALSEAHQ